LIAKAFSGQHPKPLDPSVFTAARLARLASRNQCLCAGPTELLFTSTF